MRCVRCVYVSALCMCECVCVRVRCARRSLPYLIYARCVFGLQFFRSVQPDSDDFDEVLALRQMLVLLPRSHFNTLSVVVRFFSEFAGARSREGCGIGSERSSMATVSELGQVSLGKCRYIVNSCHVKHQGTYVSC